MSLVLITGDGPEHRYVANAILAVHDARAIFLCDPPKRRSWKSVLRRSRREFVDKALRQLYLRAICDHERRQASLRGVLGKKAEAFDRQDLLVPVGAPKDGVLAAKVAEIGPDIIAVYGTGIIPDGILNLARNVALNMHTGLSPWYRGAACAFWPIVEGKPDMVGATVHECTSKVDGGKIFFRERALLYRGDDLHAVFGRAVAVGAKGYTDVISRVVDGDLTGEMQDLNVGKEYRGAMLGLQAELAARRSLRRLARSWPEGKATGSDSAAVSGDARLGGFQ